VDLLLSVAFGVGTARLKKALGKLFRPVLETRQALTVKGTYHLASDIRLSSIYEEITIEITSGFPLKGESRSLYNDIVDELVDYGTGRFKEGLVKGLKEPNKAAPPSKGGDSAGVGVLDAVYSHIQRQKLAVYRTHDLLLAELIPNHLDVATVKAIQKRMQKNLELSSLEETDLSELREKLKLLFEACIWTRLFHGMSGIKTPDRYVTTVREQITMSHFIETTVATTKDDPAAVREKGQWNVEERLKKYWLERFRLYLKPLDLKLKAMTRQEQAKAKTERQKDPMPEVTPEDILYEFLDKIEDRYRINGSLMSKAMKVVRRPETKE
jgi:hypothetical protein